MPQVRGSEIRQRRLRLGLKKSELATLTRSTYKTIDHLEHGRQGASIELVYRLANAIGAEPEDLLAGDPA